MTRRNQPDRGPVRQAMEPEPPRGAVTRKNRPDRGQRSSGPEVTLRKPVFQLLQECVNKLRKEYKKDEQAFRKAWGMRDDEEFSIEWATGASRKAWHTWGQKIKESEYEAGTPEGEEASERTGWCKVRADPIFWMCVTFGICFADLLEEGDLPRLLDRYPDPADLVPEAARSTTAGCGARDLNEWILPRLLEIRGKS